ncbi:hypothetical protein OAL71_01490 [Phycisphaerales bacterium]|nr:hypothetical protein [Phycisphaerales bacterium]
MAKGLRRENVGPVGSPRLLVSHSASLMKKGLRLFLVLVEVLAE